MASIDAQSGKAASMARRQAMSEGKAALPPATERVRDGFRSAAPAQAPSLVHLHSPAAEAAVPVTSAARLMNTTSLTGRAASLERRRALSAGKTALGAPLAPAFAADDLLIAGGSARDVSRARRAALSQKGRSDADPAGPTRPLRAGTIDYAPKVVESITGGGQRVTGSRIGRGQQVTGDEPGRGQPVSGTQYIELVSGGSWRAGGPKVGHARTANGLCVSGTLVRSAVPITGDEAGAALVTGKVDQSPADDLTVRAEQSRPVTAQFQRRTNIQGASALGSRDRPRVQAVEATEHGLAITGSAVGRSIRVTGDEGGACRNVTGSQYLSPARRQSECGFAGGGTAPAAQLGLPRPDPASAAKVSVALSWAGQRITGMDLEHNTRVTGDAPGSCSALTGTQYQGLVTVEGYCEPKAADTASQRRMRGRAGSAVTGNTALHADGVTGTGRGAGRDITGTSYFRAAEPPAAVTADPVVAIDSRFSIRSPQRTAQLVADPSGVPADRITGSFAAGANKLTGNLEFQSRSRASEPGRASASTRLSGEGSSKGRKVSGTASADQDNVTGTDGAFATGRNPSLRGPKAKPFAGATTFKATPSQEEPKQLVTGMFYFSKTGARVTLSGGAKG